MNQCTNMCDLPKVAAIVKDVVENRDAMLWYVLNLPSDGNSVEKMIREQTINLLMSKHEAVFFLGEKRMEMEFDLFFCFFWGETD